MYRSEVRSGDSGTVENLVQCGYRKGIVKKPEKHIFICINQRPPGDPKGSCADKGSIDFAKKFKDEINLRGLKGKVRVQTTSCLGVCSYGPNMVIYPEDVWYCGFTLQDIEEIITGHIVNGRVVKRLLLPRQAFDS